MADAFRYLADAAEAATLQPEPLDSVTSAKLTTACDLGEDAVDSYLSKMGIDTPISVTQLAAMQDTQKDELKRATAKMVAYVIYSQHGPKKMADLTKLEAEKILDTWKSHVDISHTSAETRLGIANYQKEHIDDWEDPNETVESMDE